MREKSLSGDAEFQKHYFRDPSIFEEDIFTLPRGKKLKKIFQRHIKKNMKVLDAGCGTGYLSKPINYLGAKLYGTDISDGALKVAKKRGYITKVANIEESLPYKDKEFDIIACFEVIEHMHNYKELLKEFRRVLKPKGIVLLSTPNSVALNARLRTLIGQKLVTLQSPTHIQAFVKKELKKSFEDANFKNVNIITSYVALFPGITPFTPIIGPVLEKLGDYFPSLGDTFIITAKK